MVMPEITYEFNVSSPDWTKRMFAPSFSDLLKWLARLARNGQVRDPLTIEYVGVRERDKPYASASRA